jgi:hypothetical protein
LSLPRRYGGEPGYAGSSRSILGVLLVGVAAAVISSRTARKASVSGSKGLCKCKKIFVKNLPSGEEKDGRSFFSERKIVGFQKLRSDS